MPLPMVLVDVRVDGSAIRFDVPGELGSWKFSGRIDAESLSGTMTHDSGGVEKVTLRRQCGYWDR
jgi:hypothetical protein